MKTVVGTRNEELRHAWVEAALKRILPGSRILDAGAGEQRYRRFCSHLVYVSQDFGLYKGDGDGKGLQTGSWNQGDLDIVCDITEIPEPDASFDAILCTEVLEHIPDPLEALAEFSRLLRTGGRLILTAPFCSLTHFAPFHFCTGFSRYYYETHLPAHGFEILELAENGDYFEYMAQEIRRVPEVAKRYSDSRPRIWERLAMQVVLGTLARFSRRGGGSSELLHYGFHVLAEKTAKIISGDGSPRKA